MRIACVVLLVIAGSGSAAAQDSTWSITPMAGVAKYRDWADATSAVGVSVGYRVTRLLVAEADLLRISNLFPDRASGTLRAYWLGGNFIAYLRDGAWRPYAIGGVGLGRIVVKQDFFSDQTNTDVAFNLGGGLAIPVNRILAVRADLRWLAVADGNDDFYNLARLTAGVAVNF